MNKSEVAAAIAWHKGPHTLLAAAAFQGFQHNARTLSGLACAKLSEIHSSFPKSPLHGLHGSDVRRVRVSQSARDACQSVSQRRGPPAPYVRGSAGVLCVEL